MTEAALAPLAAWESFYIIVGSSGAALTGLQFVVIALIAESKRLQTIREVDAFGTPTVVHFCAVLLMSAIVSAPWRSLASVALLLGACGAAGVIYTFIVIRRARRQTGYKPELEDWLWHAVFPLVAYAGLLAGSVALPRNPGGPPLFVIGAVSLVLLFVGIHNAWDTVTYVALKSAEESRAAGEKG